MDDDFLHDGEVGEMGKIEGTGERGLVTVSEVACHDEMVCWNSNEQEVGGGILSLTIPEDCSGSV